MKTVLGCIRKADTDFGMIEPDDRIAVGVSGGKDSLLLLYALSLYRKFSGKDFSLQAVTLKLGLEPFDVTPIRALCEQIGVPYMVLDTEIAHVIFDVRKESNPCALCAKMRRGALHDAAVSLG
ncbi:MAG TPA: tRNA 2-thiocytidine(32) synthetase TtcA, partial [Candidatus Ventricola gallistercoris]|nr:tRNA 2-thiocytidine(32) synthetase TtcA [Candidatus Ventricola gallistercoris]